MFKKLKGKIRHLENMRDWDDRGRRELRDEYRQLANDLDRLTRHLGLKFVDKPPKRVVESVQPGQKEEK